MCLIAFAFSPDSDLKLVLAANRDEFHARPARPMAFRDWPDGALAGLDEQAGGTWLAATRSGRWAAVTNFRDPQASVGERSRGELPLEFLSEPRAASEFAREVYQRRDQYAPFNLLVGDGRSLTYCGTHAEPVAVAPGVHALSNGLLDAAWPKSRRVVKALQGIVRGGGKPDPARLFELMNDRTPAAADELPDTGVGSDIERFLSPPFIVSDHYGTRCTTVALLGQRCRLVERSFAPDGSIIGEVDHRLAGP